MAKPPAIVDEVTISAEIKDSALNLSAKSRAVAALDRLIGGALDIPASWLEGKASAIRGANANQIAILDAEGQAALEKLSQSEGFGYRLVDATLSKQVRRQMNVEAVAIEAKEELLSGEGSSGENEDEKEYEPVDSDWLNTFERFAEDASSDKLRKLWGSILAGEIRQPKSYSLATLRLVSELDSEMASSFEKVIKLRMFNGFILKPSGLINEELLEYSFLEEVGLLSEANGNLNREWEVGDDGSLTLQFNNLYLVCGGIKAKKVKIPMIRITRAGRELASILPSPPTSSIAEAVGTVILDQVGSCRIIQVTPNPFSSVPITTEIKVLK